MYLVRIFLLQLYWFSFGLIGLGLLLLARRYALAPRFVKFCRQTHPIILFLIVISLGMAAMLVYIVPAYVFLWPLWALKLFYVSLLVAAVTIVGRNWQICLAAARRQMQGVHFSLPLLLFVGVITLVYLTSLRVGGLIDGDAKVFISMTHQWLATGRLSLDDPYFGWNGVLNIGYSTNLRFALGALGADLIKLPAVETWFYSCAANLVLVWLSFLALGRTFLPGKRHTIWLYAIAAIMPAIFIDNFHAANLPATTALIWTILLIIGVIVYLDQKSAVLLVLAALLLATTHSFNALMAAGFLLFLVLLLLFRSPRFKSILVLGGVSLLLLAPPTWALLFPRYIKGDQLAVAWPTQTLGGFHILVWPSWGGLLLLGVGIGAIASYFWVHRLIKNRQLLGVMYGLIGTVVFLSYDERLLSLVGLAYVWYMAKSYQARAVVVGLWLYFAVLAYNPVIVYIAHDIVPYWAFKRFADFNVLHFVTPIVGIFVLIHFAFDKLGLRRTYERSALVGIMVTLAVVSFIAQVDLAWPWQPGFPSYVQSKQVATLATIRQLKDEINGKIIYSNDPVILTSIPNLVTANMVSLPYEGPSPLANRFRRDDCFGKLEQSLSEADLASARVDVVLAYTRQDSRFDNLAGSKPYLRFRKSTAYYKLYQFVGKRSINYAKPSVCLFPKGQ